jgi:hypothetical protein
MNYQKIKKINDKIKLVTDKLAIESDYIKKQILALQIKKLTIEKQIERLK